MGEKHAVREDDATVRCQHDGCDDSAEWHAAGELCEIHALEREQWGEERLERSKRYEALVGQIRRAWGERTLALIYEGEAVEWWAEIACGQLVQAWPDFYDDPVLKANHHQAICNEIALEREHDNRELRVVEWAETPFPDDQEAWELL